MVLKFIALGDMGSGLPEQFTVANGIEHIIKELKKKKLENINFIVGLGDNIYECGVSSVNDPQFKEKFEKPYKKIKKDFYMCLGNHDYSYPDCGQEYQDSPQHQIEYTNISQKWILTDKYYYHTHNIEPNVKVDFFVMDTNIDRMTKKEQHIQLGFLAESINKSTARWKILYGHHPWRSVHGHGHADEELETYFRTLIDMTYDNTIDLYMCGHDHNKQYIDLQYREKNIPLIVCGTGGKEMFEDTPNIVNSKCNDYNIKYYSNTLGFLCVKLYKDRIDIYFFDGSGKNVEFPISIS